MKKILSLVLLSAVFLTSAIFSVKAANPCSNTETYTFEKCSGINALGEKAGYTIGASNSPEYYVGLILSLVFSLLGLIFLILTIYAGIKWMTAQGNTSQVEQAKNTLVKAVVGLAICLTAYGITYFIVNIFQGTGPQNIDSAVTAGSNFLVNSLS